MPGQEGSVGGAPCRVVCPGRRLSPRPCSGRARLGGGRRRRLSLLPRVVHRRHMRPSELVHEIIELVNVSDKVVGIATRYLALHHMDHILGHHGKVVLSDPVPGIDPQGHGHTQCPRHDGCLPP